MLDGHINMFFVLFFQEGTAVVHGEFQSTQGQVWFIGTVQCFTIIKEHKAYYKKPH